MTFEYKEKFKARHSTHISVAANICKYCGKTITWYKRKDGKYIPVDCEYDKKDQVYVAKGCYGMNRGMVMRHKCKPKETPQ